MSKMAFQFTLVETLMVHRLLREALQNHEHLGPDTRTAMNELQQKFGERMEEAGWPKSQDVGQDPV